MNVELVDKLLPVVSVLAGGILGFLANYFLSTRLFNKQVQKEKEDHLKELFHEYSYGLNSLFRLIEDIIEVLQGLHNVRISRKLENDLESKISEKISKVESELLNLHVVRTKFDFVLNLDLEEELKLFEKQIDIFGNYLIEKENQGKRKPIKDEDLTYINELEEYVINLKNNVHFKMNNFYSIRFLPNK